MRLASMLMALVVLWALYERLKDPGTWRLLVDERPTPADRSETSRPEVLEPIVPGLNDQDESEVAAIQDLFERVIDRAPLKPREMDAYWRLMDWSRTQPFDALARRARQDVAFTQLWEQPEKYRGQLIRLRMHVRRVLQYDSPDNPSNITKVCEAWGWTDESRSFPYVVVFADPPEGLPIGTDVRAEIDFVGYFLKVMTYTAFDHARGAPLLVGRARLDAGSTFADAKPAPTSPWVIGIILVGGILFVIWTIWSSGRTRTLPARKLLPTEFAPFSQTDSTPDDAPFHLGDLTSHSDDEPREIDFNLTVEEKDPKPKIE